MMTKIKYLLLIIPIWMLSSYDNPLDYYSKIDNVNMKYYMSFNPSKLPLLSDSMHIGFYNNNSEGYLKSYMHLYSKDSLLFLDVFKKNKKVIDTLKGSDYFVKVIEYKLNKYVLNNKLLYSGQYYNYLDSNVVIHFAQHNLSYFLVEDSILYAMAFRFENSDSMVNYKFKPIEDPGIFFKAEKEAPIREKNFQELCAENDTNTIGYYYDHRTFFRLYLTPSGQPAIMMPDEGGYEAYRVAMLPNEDGSHTLQAFRGFNRDGSYMILSKDSMELSFYDKNDHLDHTRVNEKEAYVYDGWDIGISCKEEYYTLDKNKVR